MGGVDLFNESISYRIQIRSKNVVGQSFLGGLVHKLFAILFIHLPLKSRKNASNSVKPMTYKGVLKD